MFSKLKQIRDLRQQAKTMQNMLAGESATIERGGIKIVMDGNMNVTELTIADGLTREQMQSELPRVINDAIKSVQKIMAKKMQEMGGLSNFGM